jgi:hypothetical protein
MLQYKNQTLRIDTLDWQISNNGRKFRFFGISDADKRISTYFFKNDKDNVFTFRDGKINMI